MKKLITLAALFAASFAWGDSAQIEDITVNFGEISASKLAPGADSNALAAAAAHALRVDNPHGVTAAQAGSVSTNDARYKASITNETTTLAQAAARGGFAGTEDIRVTRVAINDWDNVFTFDSDGLNMANANNIAGLSPDGLMLDFLNVDGYHIWEIRDGGLYYTHTNSVTGWVFERQAGTYTVAATSDLESHSAATNPHPQYATTQQLAQLGSSGITTNDVDARVALGISTVPTYSDVTNAVLANQQFVGVLYGMASLTSDLSGYKVLTNVAVASPLATVTNLNTTNNAYVAKFITAASQRVSTITKGSITVRFHARKGASGAATVKPEFYLTDASGNVVSEYETGSYSSSLTTISTEYAMAIPIPSNITVSATYRAGVYIKAAVTSGTPDIYVDTENNEVMSVDVPLPSAEFVTQSQLFGYTTFPQVTNIANSVVAAGGYATSNNPSFYGVPTVNGTNLCEVCPQWVPLVMSAPSAGGSILFQQTYQAVAVLTSSASNQYVLIQNAFPYHASVVRINYTTSTSVPNGIVTVGAQYNYTAPTSNFGAYTNPIAISTSYTSPTNMIFYVPAGSLIGEPSKCLVAQAWSSSFPNGNVSFTSVMSRKATDAERALWNAGTWNPTNSWR